ncbi:UNVERIFIED_CONTAM: hypothetical protein RMT77_002425 [Armadillidium vulgare]
MTISFIGNVNNNNIQIYENAVNLSNKYRNDSDVKIILLWTQIRSGSRFTGELLSIGSSTFYIDEPIAELRQSATRNMKTINISTFLDDILHCNYRKYREYYQIRELFLHTHTKEIFTMKSKNILSGDLLLGFDEEFCKTSKYRLCRIVIPSLRYSETLLEDEKYKLIFLIRDPRAISNSKENLNEMRKTELVYQQNPCKKLYFDLMWYLKLRKRYPDRLMHIYYEDLASNTKERVKEMYRFIGLPYTNLVEGMMMQKTNFEPQSWDPYSTLRVSTERTYKWRFEMSFEAVKDIQKKCRRTFKILGYRIFRNEKEYKNLNESHINSFKNYQELLISSNLD